MNGDGVIQYGGRDDCQVKIKGYRIELGEIEHALMRSTGSAMAIADVAPLAADTEEIYCVLPKGFSRRSKEIRRHLKSMVPHYMIPRHFYFTDDFPLNPNGKTDRGALKMRVLAGSLPRGP